MEGLTLKEKLIEKKEITKNEIRKICSTIGLGLLAMVIASIGTQFVLMYIFEKYIINISRIALALIINSISMYLIGMLSFKLIVRKIPMKSSFKPVSYDLLDIIELGFLSIGAMYVFNLIGVFIISIIGLEVMDPVSSLVANISGYDIIVLFINLCIVAPIFEELLFRKWILNRLRPLGSKKAIFVSSILFAFLHMNISQGVYAFGIGLILGYMAVKSGSIKVPIITHMFINFVGGMLMPMLAGLFSEIVIPKGDTIAIALVLWFLVCGAIVFVTKRKHLLFCDELVENKTNLADFSSIYINAGMILFLGYSTFMALKYIA